MDLVERGEVVERETLDDVLGLVAGFAGIVVMVSHRHRSMAAVDQLLVQVAVQPQLVDAVRIVDHTEEE